MFERGLTAKTLQFLIGLEPDFLDDVFDLAFAAGIAAGSGENAGGILLNQRLKAGGIAFQDCRYQFRFGPFHRWRTMPDGQRNPKAVFLARDLKGRICKEAGIECERAETMWLEKGSTRLRRVVCGVSPQTSFDKLFSQHIGKMVLRNRLRDADDSTRDECGSLSVRFPAPCSNPKSSATRPFLILFQVLRQ